MITQLARFFIKVIDIIVTLIKDDHNNRKLIDSLDNLTRFYDELTTFYKKQGNCELVEDYLKKKILIRQKILGEFNEKVATAINNLAYFYAGQGRNELAEKHFYEDLRIYEHLTLIKGDNFKHYKLAINQKIQDLNNKAYPIE